MLTETLMALHGWDAVWFLNRVGGRFLRADWRPWKVFAKGGVLVGVWTGPDNDLLCVKRCATNAEAERWLSPGGRTMLGAALGNVWLLRRGGWTPEEQRHGSHLTPGP